MNLSRLKAHLRQAEGFRPRPYLDTVNVWTCGYGRALPRITRTEVRDLVVTRAEAEAWLDEDVAEAIRGAASFSWWIDLDPVRQAVIVELVYNMGRARVAGFVKTIAAIERRDWATAARELLDSKWARQVGPDRSRRLAHALATGQDV